jgi:hypothetical protein
MAVKFGLGLQSYRSKRDKRIWLRYEPLTDGEIKEIQEAADDEGEDAQEARTRDAIGRIKEMWHDGTCYKNPEDIWDTISDSPAFLSEVLQMLGGSAYVDDTDAPFSSPPSTGR